MSIKINNRLVLYVVFGGVRNGKKSFSSRAYGAAASYSLWNVQSRWHHYVKLFAKGVDIDAREIPRQPLIIHGPPDSVIDISSVKLDYACILAAGLCSLINYPRAGIHLPPSTTPRVFHDSSVVHCSSIRRPHVQ